MTTPKPKRFTDADLAEVSDNPEWTAEDFARAKRGRDVLPAELLQGIEEQRRRGRPRAEETKVPVTIRLDRSTVETFKATGAGWQTRVNETLGRAAKRLRKRSA